MQCHAQLLCASSVLRRSRGLLQRCAELRRSRGRPGLLRSGCRADLLRPGRDLLPGPVLLRSLQQLLQAKEVQEELVQGHEVRPRLQEESLLPDELLRLGPDLLRSGCSGLLRSGCSQLLRSGRRTDLCRSGRVLLPLVINSELPGVS